MGEHSFGVTVKPYTLFWTTRNARFSVLLNTNGMPKEYNTMFQSLLLSRNSWRINLRRLLWQMLKENKKIMLQLFANAVLMIHQPCFVKIVWNDDMPAYVILVMWTNLFMLQLPRLCTRIMQVSKFVLMLTVRRSMWRGDIERTIAEENGKQLSLPNNSRTLMVTLPRR